MQITMEISYYNFWFKLSQSSYNSKFAMFLQYIRKEVGYEVDFLHAGKYQSFPQGGTITTDWNDQAFSSIQSNKFSISQKISLRWHSFAGFRWTSKFLQVDIIVFDESGYTCPKYWKNEVGNIFAIFYEKMLQLLLCSFVKQNVQIFYRRQ